MLVKSGQEHAAIAKILETAKSVYGEAGRAAIKYKQDTHEAMTEAAMLAPEGGGATPKLPDEPKLPDTKINQQLVEQLANIDKLNVANDRRAEATARVATAQSELNDAKASGDANRLARAQEGVATAEKERDTIHTTMEENAHRATMTTLEESLAAARDNAHDRVAIEKQILEENKKYYKENSTEYIASRRAVSEAERAAGDQDYRIRSLKFEQQIVDAKGNLGKQKQIYNEWLEYAKGIYKEDSTEYQQVLLKREEALHRHTGAAVDMTKEQFRQEIAAADGNYKEQLKLEDQLLAYLKQKYGERSKEYEREALHRIEIANREAKQEAAIAADAARTQEAITRSQERMAARLRESQTGGTKISLLDLLGFSAADVSAFEEELNQVTQAHETAMAAIRKQQEAAVNPREFQTALNDEKRELQNFAEETQKIQLQEANATKKAWQGVTDSIASELGSSITKMVTGSQTALRSLGSLIETVMSKILTWSLKLVGRWIVDRLLELHTSQATEAGKTAATAAGTATRTGIQATATAKETGGFFIRVIKWIASELGMTGATTTGAATRTGEEIAADAKGAAATSTTNVAKAQSNIGVAATAAAAAVAGIPIVGPGLAAGAAASMVATLEPFAQMAALDIGAWDVPRDMVAQIHKNEMVVPADFASGLRGQLSGTGPSNPISLNFQPNIAMSGSGGLTRNAVQTIMSKASGEMYNYMRNVYRNGSLILPGSRLV
jgi:hypothetical protein